MVQQNHLHSWEVLIVASMRMLLRVTLTILKKSYAEEFGVILEITSQ